ncbi:MAG: AraC family transcriptional regulator [Caldilineaceae bacterium]
MKPSKHGYQPTANQPELPGNFAKILLSTPPTLGKEIALTKVQLAPIHEFAPGHFEAPTGFTMNIGGIVDVEAAYENRRHKTRSGPGEMGFSTSTTPAQFRWNGPVLKLFCWLSNDLWTRTAAEYTEREISSISTIPQIGYRDALTESILWTLLHELEIGNVNGRLYVESLVQTLIIHTLVQSHSLSHLHDLPNGTGLTAAQLRQVREFIEANFSREIGLAELAAALNFSPDYFARQFKRSLGITPHQYLTQVRVEQAKRLLEQGKLAVSEVAAQVGFYDQSHLTHHFKRQYGVPPKVYLKQVTEPM